VAARQLCRSRSFSGRAYWPAATPLCRAASYFS
jgi:hypothetical protein